MINSSNVENLGKLIIISGDTGSGKGLVTKILNNLFIEKSFSTSIIPTGMFFRAISKMITLLGKSEFLINENYSEKIIDLIIPILENKNWQIESNGIINLNFDNKKISLNDKNLMTNEISSLISKFAGIKEIREKLFGKELIGKIVEESLNSGKIVLYDARFAIGEFDHNDLKFLYENRKLIILEIKVSKEALRKIAVFRTIDAIGKENASQKEIEKTFEQILIRTKSDHEKGIIFPEKYVKENFPKAYFVIENEGNGLDKLNMNLLSIAEKIW